MPWATPPWIWPSAISGLIKRPASSATRYFSIATCPVSTSTSTTATWQALGKVPGGSSVALSTMPGRVDGNLDGFPRGRDLHAARREGGGAVAGALGKSGEPDAEVTALRTCVCLPGAKARKVGGRDRRLHGFPIAGVVKHEPGRRR